MEANNFRLEIKKKMLVCLARLQYYSFPCIPQNVSYIHFRFQNKMVEWALIHLPRALFSHIPLTDEFFFSRDFQVGIALPKRNFQNGNAADISRFTSHDCTYVHFKRYSDHLEAKT